MLIRPTRLFPLALALAPMSAQAQPAAKPAAVAPDASLRGPTAPDGAVWLDTLDLGAMTSGFGRPTARLSVAGNPLRIGGATYVRGIGTHANSEVVIDLRGRASKFLADVGIDDQVKCLDGMNASKLAATRFRVYADGKLVADSGVVRFGEAKRLEADLSGRKQLRLIAEKEKGARFNHVDWAGAAIVLAPGADGSALKVVGPGSPPKAEGPVPAPLSAEDEALVRATKLPAGGLWLETLALKGATTRGKPLAAAKSVEGQPIQLAGVTYPHGIGLQGESELRIALDGVGARRFVAMVGLDSAGDCGRVLSGGGARFEAWVDGRRALATPELRGWHAPVPVSLDLTGAKELLLVTRSDADHLAWAGAVLLADPAAKSKPRVVPAPPPEPVTIAKSRPDELRINGPRIVGTSPGKPFVFLVPATGKAPITFAATGLPEGLALDGKTGVIAGSAKRAGRHVVDVTIADASGAKASRKLTIVAQANQLALTPPMGWNSWNVWGTDVDADKVRAAADGLVKSGLAAHGFSYVNIDDAWEGKRDAKGEIQTNEKFGDMKALADYVHAKGLKLGIYSSPGPLTCAGFEGSYKHEAQDAKTFARWGIDYLKHDWCSYGGVVKKQDLPELQKPYKIMATALQKSGRDIVLSLCQYGMGDVWKWGKDTGGQLWRTTGDIVDTWGSLESIGFAHADRSPHAGPGAWNDPDMLIVGKLGWSKNIRDTRLTPAEQVTHISLWSLLAAPLLLGNDLTQIDGFTLDLLTNPEVIDVDQDPLGKAATRKVQDGVLEVWARPLADGTMAVGLFNRGLAKAKVAASFRDLGLEGAQPVRDLWLRKDLGAMKDGYTALLPAHGAALIKVGTPKPVD